MFYTSRDDRTFNSYTAICDLQINLTKTPGKIKLWNEEKSYLVTNI